MSRERTAGLALVICAPSGTGKTTLVKRLVTECPRFAFSISSTTRLPRQGERNGVDYNFISREEFVALREHGHFAEWAEVHGNFYGTPLEATRELLRAGRDVLFDIDVQGAAQIKKSLPAAYFVFILPPSKEELERRLRGRGTDSRESVSRRLENAAGELSQAHWFDALVLNDDLELAYADLRAAYMAAGLGPARRQDILDDVLKGWRA